MRIVFVPSSVIASVLVDNGFLSPIQENHEILYLLLEFRRFQGFHVYICPYKRELQSRYRLDFQLYYEVIEVIQPISSNDLICQRRVPDKRSLILSSFLSVSSHKKRRFENEKLYFEPGLKKKNIA